MKKTYLKPETETIIMNAERVICASDNRATIYDEFAQGIEELEGAIMEAPRRNSFDTDLW